MAKVGGSSDSLLYVVGTKLGGFAIWHNPPNGSAPDCAM